MILERRLPTLAPNVNPPNAELQRKLEECLPAELRGPATTITRMASGMSGAGVYRVDVGGRTFALKLKGADEPLAEWRWRAEILRCAAGDGVAPRVVHIDESRRAIVSEFITDRGFVGRFTNPATRDSALTLIGQALRRVHALPLPAGAAAEKREMWLAATWTALDGFPRPSFFRETVQRVLAEAWPPCARPTVLSHNDVNPSNLVYDGVNVLLFDWDAAGPNDPLYDLAAIAVFLRMDDATCRRLIAIHDEAPETALPARFLYHRRLVPTFCALVFMKLARERGHAGATGGETLESAPTLGEFYQRMVAGTASLATAEGLWQFGLAMAKTSAGY